VPTSIILGTVWATAIVVPLEIVWTLVTWWSSRPKESLEYQIKLIEWQIERQKLEELLRPGGISSDDLLTEELDLLLSKRPPKKPWLAVRSPIVLALSVLALVLLIGFAWVLNAELMSFCLAPGFFLGFWSGAASSATVYPGGRRGDAIGPFLQTWAVVSAFLMFPMALINLGSVIDDLIRHLPYSPPF
jgi:hypothetical protein